MGASSGKRTVTRCIVCQYVSAKYKNSVLGHLPYSPDLALCDFYLLFSIKSPLKRTRFQTVDVVKEKAARISSQKKTSALFKTMENPHGAM